MNTHKWMTSYCLPTSTVSFLLVSLHICPLGGSKEDRQDVLCALKCYLLSVNCQLCTWNCTLLFCTQCIFVHPTVLFCIVHSIWYIQFAWHCSVPCTQLILCALSSLLKMIHQCRVHPVCTVYSTKEHTVSSLFPTTHVVCTELISIWYWTHLMCTPLYCTEYLPVHNQLCVSNQSLQRVSAMPHSTLDKSSRQHNLLGYHTWDRGDSNRQPLCWEVRTRTTRPSS